MNVAGLILAAQALATAKSRSFLEFPWNNLPKPASRKVVGMRYLLMKFGLSVVLAVMAPGVFAKGSSRAGTSGGAATAFIPVEAAQRVMHFDNDHVWQDAAGTVLVCPLEKNQRYCEKKPGSKAWVPLLQSITVPGHVISGMQFVFPGKDGLKHLLVFWRKAD